MPSSWRLLCSWSNTDGDFAEHTNSTHPAAFQKRPSPAVLNSLFRQNQPLKPMMKLILSFGQQKWSQFNRSPGDGQELQRWIEAEGFSWCSPDGLNPPLSTLCRNTACIHQSVILFAPMLPMGSFLQQAPACLRQQSLIAPLLLFAVSFLAVSFAPWNSQQDSHTDTLGGRLGLLERRLY